VLADDPGRPSRASRKAASIPAEANRNAQPCCRFHLLDEPLCRAGGERGRFVDVNLNLMLDTPTIDQQWQPLVNITGDHADFTKRYGPWQHRKACCNS